MNNESQATLLILKVKSSETEKLSYALWELPGVRGIEEGPLDGDTLFRPEAEFEILEFGSEAAQKCAEWMERESYRPKGQMLLKIYLDPAQLTLAGGETQWLKKLPSRYSYEIVSVEVLQEKDYLKAYKESVQGTHLEHGLFVGPPWSKLENTSGDYFFVEPGLAFGTGDHPTTQLCLERIKEFSLENKWKQNFRALDLGAGSGVLGVALKRYFPQ